MNPKKNPMGDVLFLTLGELFVAALTVAGFLLFQKADHTVYVGALVGAAVSVCNYAMLSFSVSQALKRVMTERGTAEMTEEEAAVFASAHAGEVQKSMKASYLIRQTILLLLLLIPLILKVANVLAAAIPLLMFRPILMVREALLAKKSKKG